MDRRLRSVVLSDQMKEQIRDAAEAQAAPRKKPIRFKRVALSVVAACLALVVCVGAAASAFPSFEQFLINMGQDLRRMVQPICLEVTDQGIRMEVVAAVNDGDTAVVFLTLQDTDGQRVDENVELYNTDLGETMFGHAGVAHFDPEARVATLRLETSSTDVLSAGSKISLSVQSILSGMESKTYHSLGVTVADIRGLNEDPKTIKAAQDSAAALTHGANAEVNQALLNALMPGWDGSVQSEHTPMQLLEPDGMPLQLAEVDTFTISNAGVVEEYLHVQQKPQHLETYSYTNLYLEYPGRPEATSLAVAEVHIGEPTYEGNYSHYPYTEYIMELPSGIDEQDVELAMWQMTYDYHIEGEWDVTFVLDDSPPEISAECAMDMNPWELYRVAVSPVGVTAYGRGEMRDDSYYPEFEVYLKDGTLVEYSGCTTWYYDNEDEDFRIKSSFTLPVDVDDVAQVYINGVKIEFDKR